jgi:hypothetical protein
MSVGSAEFYTGNYYSRDLRFLSSITPLAGTGHGVLFRAKGAQRFYAAILTEPGRIALAVNDFGLRILTEVPLAWDYGTILHIEVESRGCQHSVLVDGRKIFEFEDARFPNGMVGFCRTARGRCLYGTIQVEELSEGS